MGVGRDGVDENDSHRHDEVMEDESNLGEEECGVDDNDGDAADDAAFDERTFGNGELIGDGGGGLMESDDTLVPVEKKSFDDKGKVVEDDNRI